MHKQCTYIIRSLSSQTPPASLPTMPIKRKKESGWRDYVYIRTCSQEAFSWHLSCYILTAYTGLQPSYIVLYFTRPDNTSSTDTKDSTTTSLRVSYNEIYWTCTTSRHLELDLDLIITAESALGKLPGTLPGTLPDATENSRACAAS